MLFLNKITFISILNYGRMLALNAYANERKSYRRKQQWKIALYIFLNPKFVSGWFKLLNSGNLNFIFLHRPLLYVKPFRPYISIRWDKEKKVKVILDTYELLKKKETIFKQIITQKDGVILARLFFDDYDFFLKLGYDEGFRKEGELVLSLECEQLGGKIVSAAFSFEKVKNEKWICIIGCVQGHNINSQYPSKLTQRLMYGLRPKSFIIYSLQELSRHFGCYTIYGAGDSIQAYRKKHAIHLPKVHNIHFDYDKFWKEVGGKHIEKGWFELPLMSVRKNMQDIKSKKRSMYRRRYHMLDDLSLRISAYFDRL